jgi:putative peptidoglycan lipid II flippase
MTRVIFPTIVFLGMCHFTMGILHLYNHFTAPAFAPVFFNLLVVLSIVTLKRDLGAMSLAIAIPIGAIAQLLFEIPFLRKRGWIYTFQLIWDHPGVKQIVLLILPTVFSLASIEINVLVDTRFASLLKSGSVAALHYAIPIYYMPMSLFAITISTVLFPRFSRHTALNDIAGLKKSYSFGLRTVFLIMMPASVGLVVLANPIVRLLFERGAFDMKAVSATSFALIFYAMGLTSTSALHLTNRVFYSLEDTLTPTIITMIAIAVNYFGDWILSGPLLHGGIALSTSIVMTFNFCSLLLILRMRIGRLGWNTILNTLAKVCAASCILGISAYLSWRGIGYLAGESLAGQIISVGSGIMVGIITYVITAKILNIRELSTFSKLLMTQLKNKKGPGKGDLTGLSR